jgi:hypothetical protein
VIGLGNDLMGRLQAPSGRLSESVARMCLDHGVVRCVVTSSEGSVWISRDEMPAVRTLAGRRERAEGANALPDPVRRERVVPEKAQVAALPLDERRMIEDVARMRESGSGRVYTLVGKLTPPEDGDGRWRFVTQSGRPYAAVGVDPARTQLASSVVVLRAALLARGEETLLDVSDVFELDEP